MNSIYRFATDLSSGNNKNRNINNIILRLNIENVYIAALCCIDKMQFNYINVNSLFIIYDFVMPIYISLLMEIGTPLPPLLRGVSYMRVNSIYRLATYATSKAMIACV